MSAGIESVGSMLFGGSTVVGSLLSGLLGSKGKREKRDNSLTLASPAVKARADAVRKSASQGRGRGANLLTSGKAQGDTSTPNTLVKLLGR